MKSPEGQLAVVQELGNTLPGRAAGGLNMQLQKEKINKLQVEHVSEEEVDQLFYALELKEQQLAQAKQQNEGCSRSAHRAANVGAWRQRRAKFIEITTTPTSPTTATTIVMTRLDRSA